MPPLEAAGLRQEGLFGSLSERGCCCPGWGSLCREGSPPPPREEATHAAGPAAQLKMGKCKKAHWVPAGSSGSSGWSLCLAQPPSSTQPCREWVSPDQPEHVPSPTGCWQHDASSSLCLKAVKNNLFLKSAPEKRCPGPPRRLLRGSRGRGDPGSKNHPWGSRGFELKDEDAGRASAGSAACPAKRCGSLLLAVGVWCRRELLMTALHLPKCRARAPSRARQGAECSSPQVRCQPVGQGLPSWDGSNSPCSSRPLRCQVEGPWAGGEAAEPAHMLPNGEQ